MPKDNIQENSPEGSLRFKKERRSFKVLVLAAALMDMRVRCIMKRDLSDSVRALLKDGRLKGIRITDVLIQ
ncbi:MAG: hypothetical protein ABSC57_03060 [Syntrophales bacterium]|jgi:hypothetical protein